MSTNFDPSQRPLTLSGSLNSTTTKYVQQVSYYPQGSVYYWQYGNNVWPVENYTKNLQPSTNYATVNNSASSYLMFLQENWTTNGLVGSGQECYGAAVPGANMSCISPSYGYDNLNRLTSASEALTRNPSSGTGYSRNFNYDEFGNMSVSAYSSNVPVSGLMPVTSPNTFNATNNQLKSATYDPRGNMTLVAAGSESMKYDGESRQIQTLDSGTGGTGTTNYLYDSAGQRVQKQIVGGATIVYVHDAFGQLVAEYNSAGITPVCTTCYLAYDQVGSVRLITDQKAGVVARHDYLPYGEEIPNGSAGRSNGNGFANSANVAQMFTGQERDGSTADLDYFNARHMSAIMGRFTQPDPGNAGADILNPQTWNAYAYVGGNPMGMTDPSGMYSSSIYYPPDDGLNCYSAEREDPCDGYGDGGGFFGKLPIYFGSGGPGGGSTSGTMSGNPPTSPTPTAPSEPTGTMGAGTAGETLGLPPGYSLPNPLSPETLLGLSGWNCAGGPCVPGFASDFADADLVREIQANSFNQRFKWFSYAACLGSAAVRVGLAAEGIGIGGTAAANRSFPEIYNPPQGIIGKLPQRIATKGLKWGTKGTYVGAAVFLVSFEVGLNQGARSCSSATGYTPWIFE